jgi:hypothetical protein
MRNLSNETPRLLPYWPVREIGNALVFSDPYDDGATSYQAYTAVQLHNATGKSASVSFDNLSGSERMRIGLVRAVGFVAPIDPWPASPPC